VKHLWFALALSVFFAGCHGRAPVERRLAGAGSAQPLGTDRVVAPGVVEPWDGEVRVAPNEQGQIVEILAREGEPVSQGQLLIKLDDNLELARVAIARAELAEAQAVLSKLLRGATPEELALVRADLDAVKARATQAERDAVRARTLSEAGSVSGAEAERSDSEAQSATASSVAADARVRLTERGARREDRDGARARVAAAAARLASAEAALERRRVLAPVAGTVLWNRRRVGELFAPGAGPLIILGELERLQIKAEVDELDADSVAKASGCEVFSDLGARVAGCRLSRLSPAFGRRSLELEGPTLRNDVRIREVFVELTEHSGVAPGQRLWVHLLKARG
jgi:multidrug efflux pump subunit AcrA (membrane-fusion protein)